jgi:hypothetical protein
VVLKSKFNVFVEKDCVIKVNRLIEQNDVIDIAKCALHRSRVSLGFVCMSFAAAVANYYKTYSLFCKFSDTDRPCNPKSKISCV